MLAGVHCFFFANIFSLKVKIWKYDKQIIYSKHLLLFIHYVTFFPNRKRQKGMKTMQKWTFFNDRFRVVFPNDSFRVVFPNDRFCVIFPIFLRIKIFHSLPKRNTVLKSWKVYWFKNYPKQLTTLNPGIIL